MTRYKLPDIKPRSVAHASEGQDRFPRWLLLTLSVFALLMITWQTIVCGGETETCDTWSYFAAWEWLKKLHPDPMRPPIYPLVLGPVFTIFSKPMATIIMMMIQWGIWIAGCRAMWLIARHFNVSRLIATTLVILLMVFPGAWMLNNVLQTDGPASGLVPIIVLQAIRYNCDRKYSTLMWAGAFLFILIFLKPQFMFIIPIWGITWIYLTRRCRKHLMTSILIVGSAIASLLVYKWSLYHCYRQNNMTTVSAINNYMGLRMAGLIHVDEIENPQYREILRPFIEADPGLDMPDYFLYWQEIWKTPSNVLDSINRNAYLLHTAEANRFILHRFPQSLNFRIFFTPTKPRPYDTPLHKRYYKACGFGPEYDRDIIFGKDLLTVREMPPGCVIYPFYGHMDIPFWMAWLTIISFTIWYLRVWRKQRRFPVAAFYISALLWGQYVTTLIGANCDWGRLVTPVLMLLFAAGGIMVANVKKALSGWWLKRREFA